MKNEVNRAQRAKKTSIQQRVMKYAHHIYLNCYMSWSEALQFAWELHYLREILSHGVAEFTYIKRNGETRTARGTLWPEIIPPSKAPKGVQQPNYKSISYFDLDREAWRAFSIESFVQVTRVMAVTAVEC